MPSPEMRRWTPASTASTTACDRRCIVLANHPGLSCTAWASTPTTTSSPASPPHPDFLPALAGQTIPALVIKGRCDYLSWSSAVAYLEALPDAQLVYLSGAGHNVYQDEPERFLSVVRAFLLDRPLPEPPYEGH